MKAKKITKQEAEEARERRAQNRHIPKPVAPRNGVQKWLQDKLARTQNQTVTARAAFTALFASAN